MRSSSRPAASAMSCCAVGSPEGHCPSALLESSMQFTSPAVAPASTTSAALQGVGGAVDGLNARLPLCKGADGVSSSSARCSSAAGLWEGLRDLVAATRPTGLCKTSKVRPSDSETALRASEARWCSSAKATMTATSAAAEEPIGVVLLPSCSQWSSLAKDGLFKASTGKPNIPPLAHPERLNGSTKPPRACTIRASSATDGPPSMVM
mmetsp:Transcript_50774/g.89299  ORF Transcript_50774/g.89299 Transcript_50774/m.89299 type:complete len:208 (-) Transcript_50774:347-970(-)